MSSFVLHIRFFPSLLVLCVSSYLFQRESSCAKTVEQSGAETYTSSQGPGHAALCLCSRLSAASQVTVTLKTHHFFFLLPSPVASVLPFCFIPDAPH